MVLNAYHGFFKTIPCFCGRASGPLPIFKLVVCLLFLAGAIYLVEADALRLPCQLALPA